MLDRIINWLLIIFCVTAIFGYLCILPGCSHSSRIVNGMTNTVKGVNKIYDIVQSKTDLFYDYCIDVHSKLSKCSLEECKDVLDMSKRLCDNFDRTLKEIDGTRNSVLEGVRNVTMD